MQNLSNSIYSEYLNGEKFSNGLIIKFDKGEDIEYRIDLIKELFKNKTVIHLGCCDHIPLIQDKIKNDTWLHKIITSVSKKCLGIDINKEAILYVKNNTGYENVIYEDIAAENHSVINEGSWDYLFAGEIIEHLDNPHHFLQKIREKYSNNIDKLILSIPNYLSYHNCTNILKNSEFINTDHRYWFSPYTISKILTNAGYFDIKITFCEPGLKIKMNSRHLFKPFYLLRLILLKRFPLLRETIFIEASLKSEK